MLQLRLGEAVVSVVSVVSLLDRKSFQRGWMAFSTSVAPRIHLISSKLTLVIWFLTRSFQGECISRAFCFQQLIWEWIKSSMDNCLMEMSTETDNAWQIQRRKQRILRAFGKLPLIRVNSLSFQTMPTCFKITRTILMSTWQNTFWNTLRGRKYGTICLRKARDNVSTIVKSRAMKRLNLSKRVSRRIQFPFQKAFGTCSDLHLSYEPHKRNVSACSKMLSLRLSQRQLLLKMSKGPLKLLCYWYENQRNATHVCVWRRQWNRPALPSWG